MGAGETWTYIIELVIIAAGAFFLVLSLHRYREHNPLVWRLALLGVALFCSSTGAAIDLAFGRYFKLRMITLGFVGAIVWYLVFYFKGWVNGLKKSEEQIGVQTLDKRGDVL